VSEDLKRLSLAAYFAEVIKFTATPEQDSGGILRLSLMAMYDLCRDKYTLAQIKAAFEVRLAAELGLGNTADCCGTPESHLLYHLERASFKTLDYFKKL
jgi:DNA repair protein RecO (recombination protein O)